MVIWGIILMLSLISILAIYSSTKSLAYSLKDGNTEYFVLKHLIMMLFGFFVIFVAHKINYKFYSGFSRVLLPVAFLLMLLTYAIGVEVNDARRWLPLPGTGLTIQTSDIARLGLLMFLARTIAKKQDIIDDFQKGFLPVMVPILAICLIIAPSDFSTAATLLLTSMVLLFIGRAQIKHIGMILLGAFVGLAILIMLAQIFDWDWLRWTTWQSRFAGERTARILQPLDDR